MSERRADLIVYWCAARVTEPRTIYHTRVDCPRLAERRGHWAQVGTLEALRLRLLHGCADCWKHPDDAEVADVR